MGIHETVLALPVAFGLAFAAPAQGVPDCAAIAAALAATEGYDVTIPPAGPEQGWCVLDGTILRSRTPGWPNLSAQRLRLKPAATGIEVDLTGLRIAPRLGDRAVDDRVRALVRLQTIDLRLRVLHDPATDVLTLSETQIDLSGGSRLRLEAEIGSADLSLASLAGGVVTRARIEWRNDGHLPRPVMELAGEGLAGEGLAGASGTAAVDAARVALSALVASLPGAAVDDDTRDALDAVVAALPQGRGLLTLDFVSKDGIGAARLGLAALTDDPLTARTLAGLLEGATISASWQPGLVP